MNKKLNVSLEFSVNSKQATQEIARVANSLKNLQSEMKFAERNIGGSGLTHGYKELSDDLYKVAAAYKTAINVDTGKLNITKFNQGLKDTNTSLSSVSSNFSRMGATGVQAFAELTKSIYNAEVPIKRTNKMIDDMWISLKNTAKWQLSSSIIHGFMSSLQSAYSYAQDLNASLNDIRIVTGYGVDEMAKFAEEANRAAKALSTTTTAYTDASLLYYQQGLSSAEVKERTDVTIKMANVTKQSGEEVSNQMTAIWNNFDDGSKSLEYYADVLANLGAKTASSTDEIAGGLEKFAAIADTIGLSYEYAASALATITATTRQSEDVVGTALKTIFARIQGLNLGETLDDGTTLNKYSEALEKVGISIYNQSGGLKEMDAILNEMGAKWTTLNSAQQTALAQTVAGVRQYNQLISLMNNWDYMQSNVTVASSSTGTLNKQQKIYEESWEAASKRVKASFESLYDTLIDEEVFIGLFDGLSKVIEMFDTFIERIGGVNNLLMLTGSLVMKIARTKISDELIRLTGPSVERRKQEMHETQEQATRELTNMANNAAKKGDFKTQAAAMAKSQEGQIAAQLNLKAEQLTEAQKELYSSKLQQLELEGNILTNHAEQLQNSEKELKVQKEQLEILRQQSIVEGTSEDTQRALNTINNLRAEKNSTRRANQVAAINSSFNGIISDEDAGVLQAGPEHEKFLETIEKITVALNENRSAFQSVGDATEEFAVVIEKISYPFAALADDTTSLEKVEQVLTDIANEGDAVKRAFEKAGGSALDQLIQNIRQMEKEGKDTSAEMSKLAKKIDEVSEAAKRNAQNRFAKNTGLDLSDEGVALYLSNTEAQAGERADYKIQTENYKKSAEQLGDEIDKQVPKQRAWQEGMVDIASATMDAVSAVSILNSTIATLKDPDVSGWEKFETLLTALPMILMQSISVMNSLSKLKGQDTIKNMLNAASEAVLAKAKKKTAEASKDSAEATASELQQQGKDIVSNLTEAKSEDVLRKAKEKNGKVPTTTKGGGKVAGTVPATGGVKSIESSLATLGPAIAVIGIAIAAIAGAIAIWDETQEWWNKNAIAAEEAKKTAESAAEGYNNLKIAHDNLTQGFEGYQKEVEGLESLKKGTLEYQEALLKANEAAYDLINNYEGLSYTINTDGLVTIDKESLETIQQEQLKNLESMAALKRQAEIDAKQAENIAQRTKFLREDIKTKESGGGEDVLFGTGTGTSVGLAAGTAIGGTIAGIKAGTLIGSWAGPIGMAVGAAVGAALGASVGAIVGAITENSETERETAAMDKLVAAYKLEGEGIFKTGRLEEILGAGNEDLAEALRANEQETRKLINEMATSNSLMAEANRRAVTERYGDLFDDVTNKNEQQAAIALSGQYLEKITNQLKTAYEDKGKFGSGLTDKEIGKAYAAIRAAKGEDIEFIETQVDNKGLYRIGDKEESLSDDAARNALAADIAQQILSGGDIVETYGIPKEKLIELAKEAGVAFGTNFIEVAKKDVNNLNNTTFGNEILTYFGAGENTQALSTNFINSIKKEVIATKYGRYRDYESGRNAYIIDQLGGEEAAKQFAQQYFKTDDIEIVLDSLFNSISTSLDNIKEKAAKKLTSTTEGIFNDLIDNTSNKIAIGELENVADQIEKAFIMGGEESAQAIADLYLALGDEADEFNAAIKNIDWDTIDIRSFRSALQDAGIDLSNVDSALLNTRIQLGRFTTSLTTTADQLYAAYQKLSGKTYGDVISEEDWAGVPEELKQFYSAAAGGGYRLTDDVGYHQYLVHSGQINSYATNNGLELTKAQEDWLRTTATVDDPMAVSDLVNGVLQYQDLSSKYFEFFKFVDEAKQQLTEDEITKLNSLEKEFAEGTATEVDAAELFTIFKEVYQGINFNYYTYLNDLGKETEERMADAALQAELDRANITWEEYDKYGRSAAGIAQARFERSIGTLVSEYEKALDDDNNFTGIQVNELSVTGWENLQTALADVLNLSVDQVSRDYAQLLIDNGTFADLINRDGSWQLAITTARSQAVVNAQNDIISLVNDCSGIASDTLDGVKSDIVSAGLITTAEEAQTAANELNTKIGEVIEGGVQTIIKYFEKMGWITHLDENGNIVVDGRTGIAGLFGVDFGLTKKDINLKEAFEVDNDQFKSLDEEVERYHEINNELEVLADNLDAISKEKDRAYGANRVKLIDQETAALKQQLSVQERYIDEIEDYLADDRAKMDKYGFMFNEDADIINYDEVMDQQIQAYNAAYQAYIAAKNAAVDTFNAAVQSGTSEEDAEKTYDAAIKAVEATWDAAQERYETFEKELQQYEESVDLLRQQEQVLQDIKYQIQDLNYEKIQYKLEVKMEINDAEMRMLDYYLNKLSDDFYSMAEAAQLMVDKAPLMTQALGNYESFYNELESAHAAGDISQEDYVDGLKQSYDGILNNLEALQDLDKEMMHYYEDTLAVGQEALAHYTSHMEHLTSVLDHYQNIVTMMNGEADFESIGTILEGKASTLNNEMKVAESNYAMLKAEQAAMQAAYDAADAEGKKYLKSSLDAINAQVDEAHEAMLSKTKEWAEAQRAIMENSMKKAAHEMEMAFTNNMGFDALNSSMDRLSSYSNEYLTKTNQIYETQKLMNTAQQAIDKTTNQAAKVRLENYNKEIRQLQEKNKLSNLELDIAKAKYDVLLAEIALEEAQNAKATVRLQRDSEGNYGYVYTADKENIAKAEQDLADAQNALYNIGLEGANDYGSKLLDLQQQLADELIALEEARAAGQYKTDEEYYAAKERLISEYNNLFEAYSAQYTTALEVDTAIQQEAWITAYDNMITKTEDWQVHVDQYTALCEESYSHWREIVQAESDIVTDLLGNVSDAVKNVTDESNNLKDKIVKEVIPAIENEYAQVRTTVLAYESLRAGLQLTIQRYEELAAAIQETMRQQALLEGQANTPEVPDIPEEFSPEEPDNKIGHSEMMDLVEDIMVHGSYKNDPERTQKILDAGYTAADRATAQQIINDIARNESAAWRTGKDWDKVLNEYTTKYGYNTGGYTGEWGPEGRLAVLHQKELILNASDTQNFLMATEILRSIADIIDINSLHSQMSQLTPVGMTTSGQQILEQAVSIEAHFPNVTDRNEIEEAFNNLINTASQYANRKF